MSVGGLTIVMRIAIALLGVGAVWMALEVQSVQALWFFHQRSRFVLLFPQLVALSSTQGQRLDRSPRSACRWYCGWRGRAAVWHAGVIPYPEWMPFKTIARRGHDPCRRPLTQTQPARE
jgi:hypothetical protein